MGPPWWLSGKESTCQCMHHRFSLWVEKVPWRRKWQPFQFSCLGNPVDRGDWQATVHGVTKVRHNLATIQVFIYSTFYV